MNVRYLTFIKQILFILEIRRISGSLLYYLISDSKELAKYIFDKILKKISHTNNEFLFPDKLYTLLDNN